MLYTYYSFRGVGKTLCIKNVYGIGGRGIMSIKKYYTHVKLGLSV